MQAVPDAGPHVPGKISDMDLPHACRLCRDVRAQFSRVGFRISRIKERVVSDKTMGIGEEKSRSEKDYIRLLGGIARRYMLEIIVIYIFSAALAGCVSGRPPRAAMLDATIVAGPSVNPDDDGRASPVVVEIFELSSLTPFQDANFDGLYVKGKQTLGDSLLATHSTVVSPGARKAVTSKLAAQTNALGVIAGFAHFDKLQWRGSFQTQPGNDVKVAIAVDGSGINIQPAR
ncbi:MULTISPECIES: type VI secretion system lipoprotein TssJ [unclassified Chelatococcus]|uniref:type VI secretion system lipoprotein TssJ n=1 Tax=unclassified Chelatococcus TaxID=2638111 RepID=UPI001BCBF342|nr:MULTISPECIES: type VI secretion system lipoprotein TssJ [unclassified Chelatococcus]CAH1653532.1 hypothetical protein CHELA41_20782 [Hyphomicrobiales bacterium]MBS7740131.1 type VI secretion system lipoprotein TssJ [Chelatococcus sp. HY11]MBX3545040.1 type VI secretion system lipoprotein TssJ [Chelatococcus sp.]MCO5078569.1 type VI secretion system lipoprotein TssJ [Chelatococcus sp.]CAH1685678.1 hypothetical protein CHELA20_54145 [Hyphomicrobiales bacterium]